MAGSRTFAWARATAVATLAGIAALWLGYLALLPASGAPLYQSFPSGMWAIAVGGMTGVAFLASVILLMEYRVRSKGSGDPGRRRKLRQVSLLLTPGLLHVLALGGAVLYAFGQL